ncbi:MAG: DNA polymerase III subunit gamma/tau, partial [Deferrisomatales bacterium]
MSYLVLARKWRPQTFDELRGQGHIVRALRNAISSGRIAHAYVFTGIRGVGKTSAARVLAKALNCVTGPTPTPCNACESCRAITEGRSPDVLEIDGASNTGVDDVRRLREAVRYPPVGAKYRVYIIDEVHMLSTAAFNALLKTLEEPPGHVVFVFATTDAHKIPVTILSRCQQFDFRRLSPRDLSALLADVARAEGIEIAEKGLAALAREADGSVRDAQSLLDQVIAYAGQQISYEDVRDVLGVVDRDVVLAVGRAVLAGDARGVVEAVAHAQRFGYDVRRFAHDLADLFRDLAVLKAVEGADDLVELTADEVAAAREALAAVSWEDVHARFDMLSRGVEALRASSRPDTVLEMTLLKMARLPPVLPLSEVLERAQGWERPPASPARPRAAPPAAPAAGPRPEAEPARPPSAAPAPPAPPPAAGPPPAAPEPGVARPPPAAPADLWGV